MDTWTDMSIVCRLPPEILPESPLLGSQEEDWGDRTQARLIPDPCRFVEADNIKLSYMPPLAHTEDVLGQIQP